MSAATVHQEPETIEAARAYLAGENPPEENAHHDPKGVAEDVLELLAAAPVALTREYLAATLPDITERPTDEDVVRYNGMGAVERAIDQVVSIIANQPIPGPDFYFNEVRLLQRRLLSELLALWEAEHLATGAVKAKSFHVDDAHGAAKNLERQFGRLAGTLEDLGELQSPDRDELEAELLLARAPEIDRAYATFKRAVQAVRETGSTATEDHDQAELEAFAVAEHAALDQGVKP